MARKFLTRQETTSPISYDATLPTDSPIAIYYRQSSDAQVGNVSTTMQTVDMVKYLQRQGWSENKIIMIDMDEGVSGMTKIDEREGMRLLFRLITENKIRAVACQDEDRLFRDITQIQVNVFIEACRTHNVQVITPTMVYNFSHELLGIHHARQFRFKSEMAAEYLRSVITGVMLRAKQSLANNGQWTGGVMPVGYMVDTRKTLPDGSRNEQYKKYAVFEPYARVIREYFRLYQYYSGNLAQTLRHIHKHSLYYPDPATCLPPEGYKVKYRIKQNAFGWCPYAKQSLVHTLTNPAYIGHWVVKDVVVKWNNHPAIVDDATFYFAFNRYSSSNLDGSENTKYRPMQFNERPSLDEGRPEERPLLSGLIFAEQDGQEKQVGTRWNQKGTWSGYYYSLVKADGFSTRVWAKTADFVDASVVNLLLKRLRDTFNYQTWEEELDASIQGVEVDLKLKKAQLTQLKTVMTNLENNLSALTLPPLIAAIEKRYQDAQTEHARLSQEITEMTGKISNIEQVKTLKDTYQTAVDNWESSSRHVQRETVHAFIHKIMVEKAPGNGKINLIIHWRDGAQDKINMGRKGVRGTVWLPQDATKLTELVDSGANQLEIAAAFPDVEWVKICRKYRGKTKRFPKLPGDRPIGKNETYKEYLKRVGGSTVTSGNTS